MKFFKINYKEFKKFYPILLPIIYFQIMALIFYGFLRFRLPVEPYIFILSIIGILEFRKWILGWAASSCVVCDVPDNSKVLGVPGKISPRFK